MIKHRHDGYYVTSHTGENIDGPFTSRAAAFERLRQVEFFAHNTSGKVASGLRENPPWVNTVIAQHWNSLVDKVKPETLPKIVSMHPSGRGIELAGKLHEFGCGAYGCVYETQAPNLVMKVTTDVTEAEFAAQIFPDLKIWVTVRYYTVAHLKDAEHDHRKVFLLWRESAAEVGKIASSKGYGRRARDLIHKQHHAAQQAYDAMQHQEHKRYIDACLHEWVETLTDMADMEELVFVADGMRKTFENQRVFFGDVHEGNLGLCIRDGREQWVITDPGHVAVVEI